MAGTVTHTYFSMDVYKKLDKKTKDIIKDSKLDFQTFSQGHDVFFFKPFFRKKEGEYFHRNDTQNFFINMIEYIRKKHLQNDSDIMAFLYGYVCHYSLDTITHPFIIYKGGYYYKKDKKTLKYNGGHSEVESYIDAYLINKREKLNPNELDVSKFCFTNNKLSKKLILMIDSVFYDTFKKKNMGEKYNSRLKRMKKMYHFLRYDKHGRKKKFYLFLDKKLPKKMMKFKSVSYKIKLNKNHYFLNLDKRKWNHPMYKNETYTDSFDDLYKKSIDLSIELINACNAVLFYNKTTNYLKKYFKNISFESGKSCNDKKRFRYFEF